MNTDLEHSEQQRKQSRWGFRGMTVRDWLQLLIVPLALVIIGFLFSVQQDARQQRIEDQRAAAERELAEQRAQDEALQAYLDQMGSLLLERDLRTSKKDSEVRTLARARTLTVLGRLDPSRKTAVMQFLVEADLVKRADGRNPIIGLNDADLSGANLSYANLIWADLQQAQLRDANLRQANLGDALLIGADLSGADLSYANLHDADLSYANLRDADLDQAFLMGSVLFDADLRDADLHVVNKLSDAYLMNANLRGARGITNEELEQQARSLEGATMPNGQKYEEWLKSKGKGEK